VEPVHAVHDLKAVLVMDVRPQNRGVAVAYDRATQRSRCNARNDFLELIGMRSPSKAPG
jgi:hypothetical protein